MLKYDKNKLKCQSVWNKLSLIVILDMYVKPRKLEIDGTISAIFVIKTPRYGCCFVSLM